jgi:hypothetical protein
VTREVNPEAGNRAREERETARTAGGSRRPRSARTTAWHGREGGGRVRGGQIGREARFPAGTFGKSSDRVRTGGSRIVSHPGRRHSACSFAADPVSGRLVLMSSSASEDRRRDEGPGAESPANDEAHPRAVARSESRRRAAVDSFGAGRSRRWAAVCSHPRRLHPESGETVRTESRGRAGKARGLRRAGTKGSALGISESTARRPQRSGTARPRQRCADRIGDGSGCFPQPPRLSPRPSAK